MVNALRPDDVLWIHDYHLMLLPKLVREKFPEMPIGFFLHIPFPSWEVFRMLPRPWREEIIEGLLGSSLIGFHTHDYVRDFLTSVLRTSGYEHQLGSLTLRDRVVKVDTFPMGVEFDRFEQAAKSTETELQRGGTAPEVHRPEGDFFRGPAGLHEGPHQPAARLRNVFEKQSRNGTARWCSSFPSRHRASAWTVTRR